MQYNVEPRGIEGVCEIEQSVFIAGITSNQSHFRSLQYWSCPASYQSLVRFGPLTIYDHIR